MTKGKRPLFHYREDVDGWIASNYGSWEELASDSEKRSEAIRILEFQATSAQTTADMLRAVLAKLRELDEQGE